MKVQDLSYINGRGAGKCILYAASTRHVSPPFGARLVDTDVFQLAFSNGSAGGRSRATGSSRGGRCGWDTLGVVGIDERA